MTVLYFNPTIEVATICLREWYMVGVFLLLAFTRLGHECQDLLSSCDECLYAQTGSQFILSPERLLEEWSQNPC